MLAFTNPIYHYILVVPTKSNKCSYMKEPGNITSGLSRKFLQTDQPTDRRTRGYIEKVTRPIKVDRIKFPFASKETQKIFLVKMNAI